MKRGISFITSLMMTASVFGGAASQAFNISPVSVVSAASEQPVISIGDSAFNGITKVSYGVKKVTVPVRVTASDLCSLVVDVQVKADKAGEKDPVITDIKQAKYPVVMANAEAGSTRRFVWTQEDLVAPKLDDAVMAYVEITLPDDTSKDSTYTLTIVSDTLDGSDKAQSKDYAINKKDSDLTEKIIYSDNTQEDYTLKFAEKAGAKWNTTKKIIVKAGDKVPVGLEIQSPVSAIGAAVYEFDLTEGAKISGFDTTELGEYLPNEALTKMSWTYKDKAGYTFKDETHLLTVNVDIPADAKPGSVYTLSMISQDTSTPAQIDIAPASLPSVELVIEDESVVPTSFIELQIGEVKVKRGTTTAELPVYVKNGEAAAIVAMFEASYGAKVVNVDGADVVAGEVIDNEAGDKVTWTNAFSKKLENHKFTEDGEKLFVLTVEIPADLSADINEIPVDFVPSIIDISDADQKSVSPKLTAGKIIIEDDEPVTTEPPVTTAAPETTVTSPVTTEASETTTVSETTVTSPVTTAAPGTTAVSETTVTSPVTTEAPGTTVTSPVTTAAPGTTEASETTVTSPVTTEAPGTTVTSPVTTAAPGTTVTSPVTTVAPGTTVTSPVTTSAVTTTSGPVVTPPVITLPINIDPIVIPDVDDFTHKVIPEDYKPEFYYEHEKSFYKLNDDFSAKVEVIRNIPDSKEPEGYKSETIEITLTKENFVFPTTVTPKTVYDETKFSYTVPVTLDVTGLNQPEDIKTFLEGQKITVQLPVYIGQLGDVTLDHKVDQIDATFILREIMAGDMGDPSVIDGDEVLGSNTAAQKELGEYIGEFARFLGDADLDGKLGQTDATFILRACLERDMSGAKDKNRVAEAVWKKLGLDI